MTTTFEQAFAAYQDARDRLPVPGPAPIPRRADTLVDLADLFDVFLLDAFGVLNIGETAIPNAPERVTALQAAGKRVMVVSNAAGYPHHMLMQKYARLGYDFAPRDVITSRKTLLSALRGEERRHWGVMATPGLGRSDLDGIGLSFLADDPAAYQRAEGFMLLGAGAWTEQRQALLEDALRAEPREVWVGNPDIVAPREQGFSLEPGHFAHRLAETLGIAPRFFGKPFGNIFDMALAALGDGVQRERILMVGDSLHTDILGARTAGIASALVCEYGFFAGADADAAISASGIVPDFILRRP
ncbi:HAD superfamily hydrolase (TIGR01450 family) [Rhodovulum bhavnagarense]|uniref:HAD superfamily hydrolase (TIGR01450 family) n=1 Tax=Rhodovulum bhavnagarense TaxID=992286 RepID=A0A4R2RR51_9RHOB|nr:HAD-IIA family hydrolase [Rhodovulum bhavnagarense]TCP62331.1 HAD superfamily hydrolase (TIGR01450 family) [Rhodovulum bhavnagarense]